MHQFHLRATKTRGILSILLFANQELEIVVKLNVTFNQVDFPKAQVVMVFWSIRGWIKKVKVNDGCLSNASQWISTNIWIPGASEVGMKGMGYIGLRKPYKNVIPFK